MTDNEHQENMEPITRKDTLVGVYPGHTEEGHELTRVVVLCLDPHSAETTFKWALKNFIVTKHDLVVLIHVRQIDIPVAPYINTTGYIDDISEERRTESHRLLRLFAEELHKKKIACKAISMVGDPKSEIVRKAKEVQADVVLMGARQMSAIKRTLLGSVSDYVAHNSPCTVIITKPEPEGHEQDRRNAILSLITHADSTK